MISGTAGGLQNRREMSGVLAAEIARMDAGKRYFALLLAECFGARIRACQRLRSRVVAVS